MTSQDVFDLYSRCVIANYGRLPVVIVRAQGSQMWDAEGKRYLDLFPGWGCSLLGYCHPRVVEAIREQRVVHLEPHRHREVRSRRVVAVDAQRGRMLACLELRGVERRGDGGRGMRIDAACDHVE